MKKTIFMILTCLACTSTSPAFADISTQLNSLQEQIGSGLKKNKQRDIIFKAHLQILENQLQKKIQRAEKKLAKAQEEYASDSSDDCEDDSDVSYYRDWKIKRIHAAEKKLKGLQDLLFIIERLKARLED